MNKAQRLAVQAIAPEVLKWCEDTATHMATLSGQLAYAQAALMRLLKVMADSDIPWSDVEAELAAAKDDAKMSLETAWLSAAMSNGADVVKMIQENE